MYEIRFLLKVRWRVLWIAMMPLLVVFQSGAQPGSVELVLEQGVDGYVGTQDTSIFEEGELSNGAGQHLFAGLTHRNDLRRALIVFDLSVVPENVEILSVRLELTVSKVQFQRVNSDFMLHKLNAPWGEGEQDAPGEEGRGTQAEAGDATWTSSKLGEFRWLNLGGDFVDTPSAQARAQGNGSVMVFDEAGVLADVQDWLDAPDQNFGWIVVGAGQARRFFASESNGEPGRKPRLIVRYQEP